MTSEQENKTLWREGFCAVKRHLEPYRTQIAIISSLGLISALANGAVPYVTGRFFDSLIALSSGVEEGNGLPLWLSLLIVLVVVQLIANNIDWIMERMRRNITTKMHVGIQYTGFAKLFRVPLSFHKSERTNELIETVSKASWRSTSIVEVITNIGPQILSVLVGIILSATINLTLASILVAGVIVYSIVLSFSIRPAAQLDRGAHEAWNGAWNDAAAVVHQVETMKQAAAETHETNKIHHLLMEKTYSLWYRLEKLWSNLAYYQRMVVLATQVSVLAISVSYVSREVITVGELIALNGYAAMFFGPFVQLGYSWQTMQNGLTAAAMAERVFKAPTEIYSPVESMKPEKNNGEVRFTDVSFSYGLHQPTVLDTISFHAKSGEVIAFVGESGEGKSTAISLISGYYFPAAGTVHVNGVDTRQYNLHDLRSLIAVVPQEIALFNETILDNIRYGTFSVSKERVYEAAKAAHIHDFIESLPNKYSTLVGERGIKLSVGQKQRIAIARAMLRDPKILILDEPTSALDAKTERNISASLEALMLGRTTFVIAHRLSTVRRANRILVFKSGRIVESGKHDDLLQIEGGVYKRLHDYQIGLH